MTHDPFITGRRMGREGQPLIIIDGFHPDPDALIADAASREFGHAGKYYPGVRADAPAEHLQPCQGVIGEVLSRAFGYAGARLAETTYSMVTTRPEDLSAIQRLPHYDGLDENRIALLHYLTGPEDAGTAFFRHRSTGFEIITEERFPAYRDALKGEYPDGPPAGYFSGDEVFERIDEVEPRFNRAVIYRGLCLHTGLVPETHTFQANPRTGRLTINTFLNGVPGQP